MGALFWWTGAAVWLVLSVLALWLLAELLWATAVTLSWMRFQWRLANASRKPDAPAPQLAKAPRIFVSNFGIFLGFRNSGEAYFTAELGYWRGFGEWSVRAPTKTAVANPPTLT